MMAEEALERVEGVLRPIGGNVRPGRHHRGVRINGMPLFVDVFLDPDCLGHIRVQAADFAEGSTEGIEVGDAPATPGLRRESGCYACRKASADSYPSLYRGDRGKLYFGFQWHASDEPTEEDLVLIDRAARWLAQKLREM